ncbi:hypothetical protein GC167_04110 [bacterium]|nr:hypothetical protein [bacterium]
MLSCSPDLANKSWEVDVLAPIAWTSLEVRDIVGDTLVSADSDGLLSLVRRQKVFQYGMDDLLDPYSSTFQNTAKLQTLDLGTRQLTQVLTLGQIASTQGALGNFININHGNTVPIPPITSSGPIQYPVQANNLFTSLTLLDGWLVLSIRNRLPIDLTNFDYSLVNTQAGNTVIGNVIASIPANATVKDSVRLNNYTVLEGSMTANVNAFASPGSNGVGILIDTTDFIRFDVVIRDLEPFEATAVFPAQELLDYTEESMLPTDFELVSMVIDTGVLYMEAVTTVEEVVFLDYEIPSATLGGQTLLLAETLPPAPPNGTNSLISTRNIEGYTVNLNGITGAPNVFNTFYAHLRARIDSTGNMVFISLEDSIFLITGIEGMMPSKVNGWLGSDTTVTDNESIDLFLFEDLLGGQFDLEAARIDLEVINPMGAQMEFALTDVRARNTRTQTTQALQWTNLGQPLQLPSATDQSALNQSLASESHFLIDETNSNLDELFEIQPNRLLYDLEIRTNPGLSPNYNGFLYRDQPIEVWLNLEVPLHLSFEHLLLSDTSAFNFSDIDPDSRVESGIFSLICDNGLPFEAQMEILALDSLNEVVDTLVVSGIVAQAELDEDLLVTETVRTVFEFAADGERMNRLRAARKLVFNGDYTTANRPDRLKLFDHYATEIRLTGEFQYRVN